MAKSFVGWPANKLIRFMGKNQNHFEQHFCKTSQKPKETSKLHFKMNSAVIRGAQINLHQECERFEEEQKGLRRKSNNSQTSQMSTCVNVDLEINTSRQQVEQNQFHTSVRNSKTISF